MNDKKNIDRLFQEKFKDFEVAPNDAVWERISESLPKKKKKRRVIALWWQIGGVAAMVTLLLTVGVSVFNTDDNQKFPIVNTENSTNDLNNNNNNNNNTNTPTKKSPNELNTVESNNKTQIVNSNIDSEQESNLNDSKDDTSQKTSTSKQLTIPNNYNQKLNSVANNSKVVKQHKSSQKQHRLSSNKDKSTKIANQTKTSNSNLKKNDNTQLASKTEIKSTIKEALENSNTGIAANKSSENTKSETPHKDLSKTNKPEAENSLIEIPEKASIEDAIAEQNTTIEEEEKEDDQNRWSITPNVAPVYFSSLGAGSPLDQQFNENSKSSDITMSYGIAGSYAISKKLKIRAGVHRVNLSQTTSDVYAYTGAETAARGVDAEFSNISFKGGEQHVSLISSTMMNKASTPELFNTKIAGKIDQKFGFIEVPLELEYNLLDKKFGINVIGGFSTFILNENEIYADINGSSTLIGEANNINTTSFSANFGLGMNYNLSKQWHINLEPTLKYQINTFNNTTGDFKPFFIGVYTGLSFKF